MNIRMNVYGPSIVEDSRTSEKIFELDKVNCARLRRPYVGLGGSVKVMGECSVSQLILGVMRF